MRMMKGKRKLLKLLLCTVLVLGMLPMYALAAEGVACSCESDDPLYHATFCDLFEPSEEPKCTCVLPCGSENLNFYCEVCGIQGESACTGSEEEQPTPYTVPTVDTNLKDIYANGIDITIEAGTDGKTKIKYGENTYLELNSEADSDQPEADLSDYTIYGGSANEDSAVVSNQITVTGGRVGKIIGIENSSADTEGTTVCFSGSAHAKVLVGVVNAKSITYEGGYYRTSETGEFASVTAEMTAPSSGYFEYIGKDHAGYVQENDQHSLVCPANCMSLVTVLEASSCSGGSAATCITKSVCDGCGKEYGQTDTTKHKQDIQYIKNSESSTHNTIYPCCSTVVEENLPHTPSYTVEGNTIMTNCGGCSVSMGSITLTDPDASTVLPYDGTAKAASPYGEITGITPEITYQKQTSEGWGDSVSGAPIDAGTYLATMKVGDKSVSVEYTIAPIVPVLSWNSTEPVTAEYTGAPVKITAPTVTLEGSETDSYEISYSYSGTFSGTGLPVNAGTYTITASVAAQGNYAAATSSGLELTITPKILRDTVITGIAESYDYKGEQIRPAITVKDGDTTLILDKDYTVGYGDNTAIAEGGRVTVTFKGNYTSAEPAEKTFEIKKGTPGVTAPTPHVLTYNAENQTLVTAGATSGGTLEYALGEKDNAPTEGWGTAIPAAKNAGTYYVWYRVTGDENYKSVDARVVEVTIGQKALTPALAGSVSKTYDGTRNVPDNHKLEIKLNGFAGNDISLAAASFSFESSNAGKPVSVIADKIQLSGESSGNYKLNTTTVSDAAGAIEPRNIGSVEVKMENTLTYNGEEQVQRITVTGLNADDYDIKGSTDTGAGSYTLTITGRGNYTGEKTLAWSIAPRPLTVTAQPQTIIYDEQISQTAYTAEGLVTGHTLTLSLIPSTEKITQSGIIVAENIKVTSGGKDVTSNYAVTAREGKLVINALSQEVARIESAVNTYDLKTVNSGDKAELEELLEEIEEKLASEDLNGEERKALKDSAEKAEALLKRVEAAKTAANTENVQKVRSVTKDTVKLSDQQALEKAESELDQALTDYSGNFTQQEKQTIQGEIAQIDGALQAIENARTVVLRISQLPGTVEPDDEAAAEKILAAKAEYDALTSQERSLVNSTARNKLFTLLDALTDYKVTKGTNGKWSKSNYGSLRFTANGPYSKFTGVKVDGKEISRWYYTAKSGSTIVSLRSLYLRSLKDGKHTLTIQFEDGEAESVFYVQPKGASPATGDVFNPVLWGSILAVSAAGLAALLILKKKNKK